MIRTRRAALAAALLLGSAACDFDGSDIVIEPEFDESSSFEAGLGDWTPATSGLDAPGADGEVSVSDDRASEGTRSARLALDAPAGAARLWIERRFDVEPGQGYSVEIRWDFATGDDAGVEPWSLLVGASPGPLEPDLLQAGDDTAKDGGGEGVAWLRKTRTVQATATPEGELVVYLGVAATAPGQRTYWIDDVRVLFTRIQ